MGEKEKTPNHNEEARCNLILLGRSTAMLWHKARKEGYSSAHRCPSGNLSLSFFTEERKHIAVQSEIRSVSISPADVAMAFCSDFVL